MSTARGRGQSGGTPSPRKPNVCASASPGAYVFELPVAPMHRQPCVRRKSTRRTHCTARSLRHPARRGAPARPLRSRVRRRAPSTSIPWRQDQHQSAQRPRRARFARAPTQFARVTSGSVSSATYSASPLAGAQCAAECPQVAASLPIPQLGVVCGGEVVVGKQGSETRGGNVLLKMMAGLSLDYAPTSVILMALAFGSAHPAKLANTRQTRGSLCPRDLPDSAVRCVHGAYHLIIQPG